MRRTASLVLGCLSLLLLLLPLAMPVRGLPVTLKADEPAYYLAALSLARDGDLLCEQRDLRRLFDAYPHLPVDNLILMSLDGWQTVYFGKPIIYSLIAAPLAAAFENRGLVAFNMALFVAMIWMGFFYLRRTSSEGLAAFFSASFFLVSVAFAYVFWLHTEVLNMFSVMACLYLAATEGDRMASSAWTRWLAGRGRPIASGAVLTLAIYNKPMLAAMAVPALYLFLKRRGSRAVAGWLLAAAVALAAQAGVSWALTDTPTPYLGTSRAGFHIEDPDRFDEVIRPFQQPVGVPQRHSSWHWLARVPNLYPRMLLENAGYFLVGRHTGLLVYLPFSMICLVLFLVHDRRNVARWLIVAGLAGVAIFFLIWIFHNWHGGGGFIGNRYFVNLYPAFLFLVPALRPAWLVAIGYLAGGLFLTPVLMSPFGAPVPQPTLQAHTRGAPFQLLPLELSIARQVPGYRGFNTMGVSIRGRKDLFEIADRGKASFRLRGASTAELWISSDAPLAELAFEVTSPGGDNLVDMRLDGERRKLVFPGDSEAPQRATLKPRAATKVRFQLEKKIYAYRLLITTRTGRNPRRPDGKVRQPQFYVGAEFAVVGLVKDPLS